MKELVSDGADQPFVQSETRPFPIARAAHFLQLPDDAILVFVLPLPNTLNEFFTTNVVAVFAFRLANAPLDDGLGGDAGVVAARLPERVEAPHAIVAD